MGKKVATGVIAVALICVGAAVYWFAIRPAQSAEAANQPSGPQLPDLGSRGRPVQTPVNDAVAADDGTGDGATDGSEPEPEPEPEVANTAREIDIWLSNLAIATKAGDRKGIALNHEMLKAALPHTLVDERVRVALDNEQSAWVRMQFFTAYHEAQPKFDWAMHVYDTRTAKFMGTDDLYVGGEIEELKLIASELFTKLVSSWQTDGTGDFRLMAMVRNVLDTEKPEWLLELARANVFLPVIKHQISSLARTLEQELRNLLQRRTADSFTRGTLFIAFILTFEPAESILDELALAEWWDYASKLAEWYSPRLPGRSAWPVDWLDELVASEAVPKLFAALLQGTMPVEHKRVLIKAIADFQVPDGREMIESGLARKDASYADYLAAFGALADSTDDLQRLTAAADQPDVAAAQGAIEGLRQSSLQEADTELRKVLENGSNEGIKSQALGALLSRTEDKDQLLEEYLGEGKDASLRAVAAQHVPLTNLERLQRIAEEDVSPSVRLVALNRVGSIVPASVMQKKELRGWFVKMKDRDNSSVIRAAARKYAEDLQD